MTATRTLTAPQHATLLAIAHGRFIRGTHHPTTLKVLEREGLLFFDGHKPIVSRKGWRFLAGEAEAAARKGGAIAGRAS